MTETECITNFDQALCFLRELEDGASMLGQEESRKLLSELGKPQNGFQYICLPKGVDETAGNCLVSILKISGYKAGVYRPIRALSLQEKFSINGRAVSKSKFVAGMEKIRKAVEKIVSAEEFHISAAAIELVFALWFFHEMNCEFVILENDMGNSFSVCEGITGTLNQKFLELGTEADRITGIRHGLTKQSFHYRQMKNLTILMTGIHQVEAAAISADIAGNLKEKGFLINENHIRKGLAQASCKSIFSIDCKKPLFIVNGIVNEKDVKELYQSLTFYFTNRKIIYIIGVLKDDSNVQIFSELASTAAQIVTVTPKQGLPAYELAGEIGRYCANVTAADSLPEAVEISYLLSDRDTVIVACGAYSYLQEISSLAENRMKLKSDLHIRVSEN